MKKSKFSNILHRIVLKLSKIVFIFYNIWNITKVFFCIYGIFFISYTTSKDYIYILNIYGYIYINLVYMFMGKIENYLYPFFADHCNMFSRDADFYEAYRYSYIGSNFCVNRMSLQRETVLAIKTLA